MKEKFIEVPNDISTYLEILKFELEGYKQLIRFLSCQENLNLECLSEYDKLYSLKSVEFRLALQEAFKTYASVEFNNGIPLKFNFILGGIQILNNTGCESCENKTEICNING